MNKRGGPGGRKPAGRPKPNAGAKKPAKKAVPKKPEAFGPPPIPPGPFRLGAVAGATPGKWIDIWNERMPRNPLEFVTITAAEQRRALLSEEVDAAIVRLPIDRAELGVIALYDESPVVVCAKDSHLTVADELTDADLEGELLIVPLDDVLHRAIPGTLAPRFVAPETTEAAIATVAAGVGIVVVPMSLARLHQRKDVDYRLLRDAPLAPVALAWVTEREGPLVETFIGVVRGRTARSSR